MWRINFQYSDGGKIKVSGKGEISLALAEKYYRDYGFHSDGGFYQESPYKKYTPEHLTKVIARLRKDVFISQRRHQRDTEEKDV